MRVAALGLIHCDFNEFNAIVDDELGADDRRRFEAMLAALMTDGLIVEIEGDGEVGTVYENESWEGRLEMVHQPIGNFQLMQGKIADMYTAMNSARAYVYEVAKACDRGEVTRQDAAACVLYVGEALKEVLDEAVQLWGARGYAWEYEINRLYRAVKVLEIGGGVDKAKALESYEDIVIESANRDAGTYNFYEVVTGNDDETSWFGYRALQQCNFKLYNGMLNALNLGANDTELEIVHEVRVANDKAGFRSIQQLYQPSMLLTQYDYSFPDEDDLPPAYTMCPFGARNEPDDPPICATSPPWKERQHKKRKVEDIASPDKGGGYNSDDEAVLFGEVDDETKGLTTGTTSAEGMGSTGTGTPRQKVKPVVKQDEESQDVGGYDSADEKYRPYSPDFSPPPAPVKRRKAKRNRFIADEASASDDESDQARAQPRMRTRSLTT